MTFHAPPGLRDALAFLLMFGGAVMLTILAIFIDRAIRKHQGAKD